MTKLNNQLKRTVGRLIVRIAGTVAALALVFTSSAMLAQSGAGSIQGTVTDSTGAVIPGASIHVVNLATGVSVDTKSNKVGFYQVPSLFTGTYSVTVTATGMKSYKQNIELLVDQSAVINATLSAGAVTQQVEVNANLVQLTTKDSGEVGTTLENARINQLPMNGRNILTLANETTPGLDKCNQAPSCANGLMPGATVYVVDGVTLESREFGGTNAGANALPDPDSIEEVKIDTSGEGAQYATPATGVMTTKSGTNRLHGSFFETARNNGWGIAKSRDDASNFTAPHLVRNEFGASIGGPIVLPHIYHGKDKSFFFFAYERYSLAQTAYELGTVPTMAMRNGDWSGLVTKAGTLQQLYDPNSTIANPTCPTPTGGTANNKWCRTPFPVSAGGAPNQIPLTRISPIAQEIYAITPQPTNSQNPLLANNIDIANPNYVVAPNITFRLDHVFNENNRAYLRYTSNLTSNTGLRNNPSNEPASIAASVNGITFPANSVGLSSTPSHLYAAAAGYTHIFSPTFFSETILSQQWLSEDNFAGGPGPTTDFESEMGLPNNFGEKGFPEFSASILTLGGTFYQYGITGIISNLDENLTKTSGKHQIQFGGRYRHERFGYLENQQYEHVDFGDYATALENPSSSAQSPAAYTNTGYSDADEFLGAPQDYIVNLQPPYLHFHDMEFDAYVQDNYHVSRNLTLNLGLRYEAHPGPWMKNGTIDGFDMKNDALVLPSVSNLIAKGYTTQAVIQNIENDGGKIESPEQAGQPSNLFNNYDLMFLPRLGFAWQASQRWGTVLRGAYGKYLYPVPIYFSLVAPSQFAPFSVPYEESYISAAQAPDALPNYLLRTSQSNAANPPAGQPGIAGVNSSGAVNSSTTNSILPGINPVFMDTDDAPDNVTQVNVTIEQPMKGNSALRLSWNYAHDSNLWNYYYFNNHPTQYVWEMKTGTTQPNGTVIGSNQYAATATGPYDQTTWGSNLREDQKTGWSTDNMLQANYQRLFHRGIAYQISYIWSKPMKTGGESGSDGYVYPSANYLYSSVSTMTPAYGAVLEPTLPPAQPAGTAPYAYYKALNKFEEYKVDTSFPKQEVKFNWIVDLPIGHNKWLLSHSNRFVDEIVGGWQFAGDGNIHSLDFAVTSSNWGPANRLQVYKHKYPVTDCTSGACHKVDEWFNGYIAPTFLPSNNSNASCKLASGLVTGLPGSWVPYQSPIDTDCNPSDPAYTHYGANEVSITLPGQKAADIAYNPGSYVNPFTKTVLNGPFNWTADMSLFKVLPITEQMNLRFNMDAFNVFNIQGLGNPNGTSGETPCTDAGGVGCSSYNTPRQLQFTLRLTF